MAKTKTSAKKNVGGAKTKKAKEAKAKIVPGQPVMLEVTKDVYFLNTVFFESNGVALGDKIEVAEATLATLKFPEGHPFAPEKEAKVANVGAVAPKEVGKVTCPVAILKGEEFIRVYPKGQEAEAQEFLTKNPNFKNVSPEKLSKISVSWRENEKRKDEDTGRVVDTGRLITKTVIFSEEKNGEGWYNQARRLASEGPRRSCVAVVKEG